MTDSIYKCDCCDKIFSKVQAYSSHRNSKARISQLEQQYLKDPKQCKACQSILPRRSKNLFCSKSCSATHNNTGRQRTEVSKLLVSKKMSGRTHNYGNNKPYCNLKYVNCKICDRLMVQSVSKANLTCSEECRIVAATTKGTFNNQKKQFFTVKNSYNGKMVTLESTWEQKLYELLEKHRIPWIRPKFIPWTDSTGKLRRYFPDFYLPDQDVYLDPKNPYLMKLDEEKLTAVSSKVKLIAGNVDSIFEEVLSMVEKTE